MWARKRATRFERFSLIQGGSIWEALCHTCQISPIAGADNALIHAAGVRNQTPQGGFHVANR